MKNWNTALHLKDIKLVMQVCRTVRSLTGSGFGKILMLGHSRGAQFVYAYANQETQLPEVLRDLKGIIPMDYICKFDPNDPGAQVLKQDAGIRYQTFKAMYADGTYVASDGAALKGLAYLATTAPDEPSPAVPGMTNFQAVLFVLTATYATATPEMPAYTPFFHQLAGSFDPVSQLPTGLQFADPGYIINLGLVTPSYQSLGEQLDGETIASDAVPVPYDDHLDQIRVLVLYVGAAGGAGEYGVYAMMLLGSSDKNTLIVKSGLPVPDILDYGHADLLWADNAKDLVWGPISQWIAAH